MNHTHQSSNGYEAAEEEDKGSKYSCRHSYGKEEEEEEDETVEAEKKVPLSKSEKKKGTDEVVVVDEDDDDEEEEVVEMEVGYGNSCCFFFCYSMKFPFQRKR